MLENLALYVGRRMEGTIVPIKNSVQQTRFLQATQKFASDGTYLGPSSVAKRFL